VSPHKIAFLSIKKARAPAKKEETASFMGGVTDIRLWEKKEKQKKKFVVEAFVRRGAASQTEDDRSRKEGRPPIIRHSSTESPEEEMTDKGVDESKTLAGELFLRKEGRKKVSGGGTSTAPKVLEIYGS